MKTKPKIKYSKKTMITIILLGCAFLIYRIYIIRSRDNFNQEECTKITTTLRIRELLEEKNYTCLHNDNIVWKDIKSLILGPTKAYYERKHVSLGLEGKDIMFGGFAFAALATYNALNTPSTSLTIKLS